VLLPGTEESPKEALAVIEDAPVTKDKEEGEAEEIQGAACEKKEVVAQVSAADEVFLLM
jgi:hypothetical protein